MDKDKLKEAIAFARENHLTSIEVDGIKMELAHLPADLDDPGPDIQQPVTPWDNLTQDEVLFWSTPYFLELEEERKLKEQHAEELRATRG